MFRLLHLKNFFITTLIASIFLLTGVSSAEATIYNYTGASAPDEGYIMVSNYTGTNITVGTPSQNFRVTLSTSRPDYTIMDTVGIRIRTDGYYTQDCGWWYMVNGTIDSLNIYDSQGTLLRSYTNEKTDSSGVWEDEIVLRLNTSMPGGKYKVNASVSGLGTTFSGDYLTVYFDVKGLLNISDLSITGTMQKDKNITINVTNS
jgi:hypothetical protein